jgi:hypothetical protein
VRRAIEALGDRLVSLVVPKVTAAACVPPDPETLLCSCPPPGKSGTYKNCHYTCTGAWVCGACYTVVGLCA